MINSLLGITLNCVFISNNSIKKGHLILVKYMERKKLKKKKEKLDKKTKNHG